jgi:hypothetical protein
MKQAERYAGARTPLTQLLQVTRWSLSETDDSFATQFQRDLKLMLKYSGACVKERAVTRGGGVARRTIGSD